MNLIAQSQMVKIAHEMLKKCKFTSCVTKKNNQVFNHIIFILYGCQLCKIRNEVKVRPIQTTKTNKKT